MCNNHNSKNKKKRFGSALEHGAAHEKDHQRWSRRGFLRAAGLAGAGSFMFGKFAITAAAANPLSYLLNAGIGERILVLIRLNGGNDGLNTVVPLYDYSTYANNRPTLAIPQNNLFNLNDEIGMPNYMNDLNPFWQEGKMKVVHSVGYPDQNLSHFRSSDIWASASDANTVDNSGWLGRFIMDKYPDFVTNPPDIPPAIQIGSSGDIVFHNSDSLDLSISVTEPAELAQIAQDGELYSLDNLPDCYFGDQLGFLRAVTNSTFKYAEAISLAYDNSTTNADFGAGPLNEQLMLVSRMIKGGLGTKLYMVSLNGFDTHANQLDEHPVLLQELASAIKNFYEDLGGGGYDKDVLCMTFSEFGRRIEQNASDGTDHGAAAPMFLFGEGLNGSGFVGDKPNLQNLDNIGNLMFDVDFRQIYASVLENWLCIDPGTVDGVLGDTFDRVDLGLDCIASSVNNSALQAAIKHEARYSRDGQVFIYYKIPYGMQVEVEIYDILGQPVKKLFSGYQLPGEHQVAFQPGMQRLANGYYVYRILAGGNVYSKPIRFVQ
jgi:uncharacterized protein (DUF1501 family)